MSKPYKLLVVDIDGTLLGKNGIVSADDRKALARAGDSGIYVSLSTGRVVQASLEVINQLVLDGYHIFADGALVSNLAKDKDVLVSPISKESVKQMVEFAQRNDIYIELFSKTHYFVERETRVSDMRRKVYGLQPTTADFTKIWQNEEILKGTLVVSSAEESEERAKADNFRLHFKNSLNFRWTKTMVSPEVDFMNAVAPGVSKGKAVEVLALFLGIPLAEVMAIGDQDNDMSLLSTAGLAIAMGSAPDELKAIADYITFDVEHSGVAAAIDKFLL